MEKPREKLEKYSVDTLGNDEIVALILAHGTKKESVFDISKRILKENGLFSFKFPNNIKDCAKYFNLNKVHSSQLLAAIELGRRLFQHDENYLRNIKQVSEYLREMKKSKKEILRGIYLSTSLEIVADEVISIGSLDKSIIHPREVFAPALKYSAHAVILAHNHPSGNPNPSDEDIKVTINIKKAAKILQIELLDHVIISQKGFFSFRESCLLTG